MYIIYSIHIHTSLVGKDLRREAIHPYSCRLPRLDRHKPTVIDQPHRNLRIDPIEMGKVCLGGGGADAVVVEN